MATFKLLIVAVTVPVGVLAIQRMWPPGRDGQTPESFPARSVGDAVPETRDTPVTRVYDVRPLIVHLPDYRDAPDFNLQLKSTTPRVESKSAWNDIATWMSDQFPWNRPKSREELVEEVMSTIQQDISPKSWQNADGTVGRIRELQ